MSAQTYRAFKKLAAAVKTLDPNQGRIARRNARRKVHGALRTIEHTINSEYPLEPRMIKPLDESLAACAERFKARSFHAMCRRRLDEIPFDRRIAQRVVGDFCDRRRDRQIYPVPLVVRPRERGITAGFRKLDDLIYYDVYPTDGETWIHLFTNLVKPLYKRGSRLAVNMDLCALVEAAIKETVSAPLDMLA